MRFKHYATLVLAGVPLAACADRVSAPDGEAAQISAAVRTGERLTGIVITTGRRTVEPGAVLQLRSQMTFSGGGTLDGAPYVRWASSNPEVAQVSAKTGLVTGIALGTASVVVSFGGKADTAQVAVALREGFSVSPASANLVMGDTLRLSSALVVDGAATTPPGVRWESSDPRVVAVSASGLAVGKGPGYTTIRVKAGSYEARAAIRVTAGAIGPDELPPIVHNAPDLPRERVETRYVAPTGKTIMVRAGGDLQKAINAAERGDVIMLEAGATFTGNFYLKAKPGSGWITIRTATPDGALPREGTRITPKYSRVLAKIVSDNNGPALRTSTVGRIERYRIMGVEITAAPSVRRNGGLVSLGSSYQRTRDAVPENLILDRVYVHGHDGMHLKRCVTLNSGATAVIDSYLAKCHAKGQDSQAIAGWNGPGPFKIVNNHLEGAGENVLFGGADPRLPGLIPSDIEIRGNHIYKPMEWRDSRRWTVKNLLELKNAQRVLIEDNVLENSWGDGQTGFAIVLKSANQNGKCPWCVTRHVTFRRNHITNAGGGVSMSGQLFAAPRIPDEQLHDVLFVDNVFDRIGREGTGSHGRLLQMSDEVYNITFDHNTAFASHSILLISGSHRGLVMTNNVFNHGRYGVKGTGKGSGTPSLNKYAPGFRFVGNVLIGGSERAWPDGNTIVKSAAQLGLGNTTDGNYQVRGRFRTTDGRDPGADIGKLEAALRGVATDM